MTEDKLNDATLRALNEEQERIQRLVASNTMLLNSNVNNTKIESAVSEFTPNSIKQESSSNCELINNSIKADTSSDNSIYVIEDDDQVNNNTANNKTHNSNHEVKAEIIELNESDEESSKPKSNEDEDDDCRIISESEHQQDMQARSMLIYLAVFKNKAWASVQKL